MPCGIIIITLKIRNKELSVLVYICSSSTQEVHVEGTKVKARLEAWLKW
jgi:hypothetical protein